jgi:hypothetical protein
MRPPSSPRRSARRWPNTPPGRRCAPPGPPGSTAPPPGSSPARPSAAPGRCPWPASPPGGARSTASRAPNGSYAIYDYKSGAPPSRDEIRAFRLQLPLEAAIAEAGGFPDLPPAPVRHLEYLGINARKAQAVDLDPAETWARLRRLIAHYQRPGSGYVARLRPQTLSYESDYDHLSRKGEWEDGDPFDGAAP